MEDDIPEIRQSSYAGEVPATNYDSYGSASSSYIAAPQGQATPSFSNASNVNNPTSQAPVLTGAAPSNAASGATVLVKNTNEDFINKKWRPMMGWTYMITCLFDFIIAPVLWSVVQAIANGGQVTSQWQPLTLQGAGLYHVAMGAVLGIAAFGRTQEKKAGVEQGAVAKY